MNTVWTHERIQALRRLADLSTVYRSSGVPFAKKEWDEGMKKLKEQDFASYKLLRGFNMRQLKWSWNKYQDVAYGYCATASCNNKIEPGQTYCSTCRPGGDAYHRGAFSKPCIEEHKDMVKKRINTCDDKLIRKVVEENIVKMPFSVRKAILGDEFKQSLIEKDLKKKK